MDIINYALSKKIKKYVDDISSSNQVQSDWNQSDESAPDYVKGRTHYEESAYVDYVLNMSGNNTIALSIAEVGETMTVKINGVESAETVKETESSILGASYKYIGNIDIDSLLNGGTGWCVITAQEYTIGFANPDMTITVENIFVHKINDKFINFDGIVRKFDYYFKKHHLYKSLYNDEGNEVILYTSDNFVLPKGGSHLIGFMSEVGFSKVGSVLGHSCFVTGFKISGDGSIFVTSTVLGSDTSEMEELAASYGYTFTTNPKA